VLRAPFLVRGDRFFDSDEAVEGLMARHVSLGEHPAFLWGQGYKGVPEVYLASALFSVAGPGVIALKSATAICFALFAGLQCVLLRRVCTKRIAWIATALTIVTTPALVYWGLSASAEIALTLVAGVILGLGLDYWRTGSRAGLWIAAGAVGFGLWVQQYMLYYVVALGVAVPLAMTSVQRDRLRRAITGADSPLWLRVALGVIAAGAAIYIALGIAAFVSGGFDLHIGRFDIGLRHPQKLWRIAAGLLVVAGAVSGASWLSRAQDTAALRALLAAAAAFAIGYAPSLIARGSAPVARMDLHGAMAAADPFARVAVPIVIGLRSPTTEWLVSPWWTVIPALIVLMSYASLRRRRCPAVFHVFLVTTPLLFALSGSFIDAQSYRYLMPVFAVLPVVLACGVDALARWHWTAGAVALGLLLVMFGVQEAAWYSRLRPDRDPVAAIACLDARGARAAYADYWVSYKVTFLSGERIIVAPTTGVDRYPRYTEFVAQSGRPVPTLVRDPQTGSLLCR
jgi:hypothetical protein